MWVKKKRSSNRIGHLEYYSLVFFHIWSILVIILPFIFHFSVVYSLFHYFTIFSLLTMFIIFTRAFKVSVWEWKSVEKKLNQISSAFFSAWIFFSSSSENWKEWFLIFVFHCVIYILLNNYNIFYYTDRHTIYEQKIQDTFFFVRLFFYLFWNNNSYSILFFFDAIYFIHIKFSILNNFIAIIIISRNIFSNHNVCRPIFFYLYHTKKYCAYHQLILLL